METMESITSSDNLSSPSAPPLERFHIVTTPGTCGGKPRISGHRITVKHIVLCHERGGQGPDEIVEDYPGLTLSDVYAALAYYFDHKVEIDADIHADDEFHDALERRDCNPLAERLRRRKADVANDSLPPG